MSRLPRSRWTRIGAWTSAALAWGTTLVMARDHSGAEAQESDVQPSSLQLDGLDGKTVQPDSPGKGLVVLRYVPIPEPTQQVITRVVTRTVSAGSASSGGGSASQGKVAAPANPVSSGGSGSGASGGGGGASNTAPPPPPPPPTPVTTAPAPVSGGS